MTKPFTTDEQFDKYWDSEYTIGTPNQAKEKRYAWFGKTGAGNSYYYLFPVYIKKKLETPFKITYIEDF